MILPDKHSRAHAHFGAGVMRLVDRVADFVLDWIVGPVLVGAVVVLAVLLIAQYIAILIGWAFA